MVKQPSCFSDYDPNSLPVRVALNRIKEVVDAIEDTQTVELQQALNRVLSEPVKSLCNVPNHTNSAMDGYAIRFADIKGKQHAKLKLVGKALAGHRYDNELKPGQCIRIMTGAVMPQGSDTVIMQEDVVDIENSNIVFEANHKVGQHVRYAGESIKVGEVAIDKGRFLNPADIGFMASLGIVKVNVYRKPRVAILATGDEVKPLGQQLGLGEVYDSNRVSLKAMLAKHNVEIIDLGIIADDESLTIETFKQASEKADAIIVSGGASVGEADYVRQALQKIGQVSFIKLAMKPGRPLSFGRINDAVFFGLPGNPVSVMVTYYQFVVPALQQLMGQINPQTFRFKVPCLNDLRKRPGRTEFQRGELIYDDNANVAVKSTGQQGSGILSSMSQANCFIILDDDNSGVKAGEVVDVQPFFSIM